MTPPTTAHPATQRRIKAEAELNRRIGNYADAVYREMTGQRPNDWTERKRDEVTQALQTFRDACYAELDDDHGLGKAGLDAARELVEDAVWFPLNSPVKSDSDAYLVDEDKLRALAQAIGAEEEL